MSRNKRLLEGYGQFHTNTASNSDSEDDDHENQSSYAIELKPYTQITDNNPSEENDKPPDIQQKNYPSTESNNIPIDGLHHNRSISVQIALSDWVNTKNLDYLLTNLYEYYCGHGKMTIIVTRITNIGIVTFLVFFAMFLFNCIDYQSLFVPMEHHKQLFDFIRMENLFQLSFFWGCCLFLIFVFVGGEIVRLVFDYQELSKISMIYHYLLGIPERDIGLFSLEQIIVKISQLFEMHPICVDRLTVHDITNRIMRKENYLIALFNKDILNISISLPFIRHKKILTKTLEWNLSYCILGLIFDENFSLKKSFSKDFHKESMTKILKQRFVLMGLVNLLLSPFIFVFLLIYFIFRYGEEFYRNPKAIGTRQYTTFAKWKFREFNELGYFLDKRLRASNRAARRYTNQYPHAMTAVIAKFAAFVLGSITFVLIVIGLFSEDLLLNLEITQGRTTIWYIGILGIMLALSRSFIPDTQSGNTTMTWKESSGLLKTIIDCTHYYPHHWQGRLYSEEVLQEFSEFYKLQIISFGEELLSVIFTPFVLLFSLPHSVEDILDFFREFTVHVDGLGYVCSFAVFDFKKHGDPDYGSTIGERTEKYYRSKQGKMEKSFLNFKEHFPGWNPDTQGSMYLDRLQEIREHKHHKDGLVVPLSESVLLPSILYPKKTIKSTIFGTQLTKDTDNEFTSAKIILNSENLTTGIHQPHSDSFTDSDSEYTDHTIQDPLLSQYPWKIDTIAEHNDHDFKQSNESTEVESLEMQYSPSLMDIVNRYHGQKSPSA